MRRGRYVFIRRLPRRLVAAGVFTQSTFRKSLGTSSRLDAERIARRMAVVFDDLLERIETRLSNGATGAPTAGLHGTSGCSERDAWAPHIEALLPYGSAFRAQLQDLQKVEVLAPAVAKESQLTSRQPASHTVASTIEEPSPGTLPATLPASQARAPLLPPCLTPRADKPSKPVSAEHDLDVLARAYEHWLAKASPGLKTQLEIRPVWQRLQSTTGKRRISELTREDVLAFQASELQRRRGTAQVRPQTVNKHFALMAAVLKLAHDDLLRSRGIDNPFASLRKAAVRGTDLIDKQDLTSEELARLFGGEVHQRGHRPKGGGQEAAFWMPVLGYATGARMGELAQLLLAEVLPRDNVWCLWLTSREAEADASQTLSTADREKQVERSLKTGHSRRVVPVHPAVLGLGFIDYVQWLRAQNAVRLFPAIKADSKNNIAGNFSKWFNGYLARVGIKRRGLDWVSFRHGFKTACRTVRMDSDVQDYLEGHQAHRASQGYGRFTTAALLDAVTSVQLPALAAVPRWQAPGACKKEGA
jgi:integrase